VRRVSFKADAGTGRRRLKAGIIKTHHEHPTLIDHIGVPYCKNDTDYLGLFFVLKTANILKMVVRSFGEFQRKTLSGKSDGLSETFD
jgi:hypothetical protein